MEDDETKILESVDNNVDSSERMGRRNFLKIGGVLVGTVGLASISSIIATPKINEYRARKDLTNLNINKGDLVSVNTIIYDYELNSELSNVSHTQKALGDSQGAYATGSFGFSNTHENIKRKVEVFVDFDSQASSDFILMNNTMLYNLLVSGEIELFIYPIVSPTVYSTYAPELLAHVFAQDSAKSWHMLLELMKLSKILSDKSISDSDTVLKYMEEMLVQNNIAHVKMEDVSSGYFASWIIASNENSNLKTGYYPPIVVVDNVQVNPDEVSFNDSDALQRALLK